MRITMKNSLGAGVLALTLALSAGCSAGERPAAPSTDTAPSSSAPSPEPPKPSDGPSPDAAVSAERANIAKALERTYSERNAIAQWTSDSSLHITLDPDGAGAMTLEQFMDCRAITQLLDKTDTVEVQYGRDTVTCSDVLEID